MAEQATSGAGSRGGARAAEAALVRRVQGGDHEAFRGLVEAYLRPVRAFVAFRAPTPAAHLVDEVAQEAFVVAFEKIGDFEAGTSFGAWVRAIAGNLLRRDLQRFGAERANREKLARHVAVLCGDGETGPGPAPGWRDERFDFLQQCLRKVSSSARELLQLKYHQGYSTGEIARRLDRSGDWVRTNLYRVRNQLRDCIQGRVESAGTGIGTTSSKTRTTKG